MSTQDNVAVVRRIYEAINAGEPDALDELIAADVVSNVPFPHGRGGRDGFKEVFAEVLGAVPDYAVTIEDQIAQDDKVVTRYVARGTLQGELPGLGAAGDAIELMGIDIDRLAGGVVVEHWSEAGPSHLAVARGIVRPR
jgi:predicted ester cyclase